jgi:hypothetical protein
MKKLGLCTMVLGISGLMAFSGVAFAKDGDCKRTSFKTELVRDACTKDGGGQKAAKDAMKAFLKAHKKDQAGLDCTSCHSKLAPDYPLKDDALKTFEKLGGKLISNPGGAGAGSAAPKAPVAPPAPTK